LFATQCGFVSRHLLDQILNPVQRKPVGDEKRELFVVRNL
jgi:hypothetical protein